MSWYSQRVNLLVFNYLQRVKLWCLPTSFSLTHYRTPGEFDFSGQGHGYDMGAPPLLNTECELLTRVTMYFTEAKTSRDLLGAAYLIIPFLIHIPIL